MLSLSPKPKFFLLNALRFLSLISLLFVLIANCIILMEDAKAVHAPVDKDHEDCDYVENSSVPNQSAGEFRAFFSLSLNLVQILVFMLAEVEFPRSFFKNWIPCLYNESLVALGVLEVLLAAQMMSHFLEMFPLVACFFLLIAGLLNISTMYVHEPKSSRSWGAWRDIKGGMAPSSMYPPHSGPRYVGDSASEKGFARHASNLSHGSPALPHPVLSRDASLVTRLPPTYSPASSRSGHSLFNEKRG